MHPAPDARIELVTTSALRSVRHGFTTRRGGVSPAPREHLCLRLHAQATEAEVRENWARVGRTLGFAPEQLAVLRQVHKDGVVRVEAPAGPLEPVAEADASYTTEPGVALVVGTADCVPVLVAGPGVVGVAHAGWRGVAARVVEALVRRLEADLGVAPEALRAAVGPCISWEAYEVGPEVVQALLSAGLTAEDLRAAPLPHEPQGRPHVDLGRAVERQLRALGVAEVERVARCTASDPALYSHRAEGPLTGRQAGVILLEAA